MVVAALSSHGLDCIIIDDGSDADTKSHIRQTGLDHPGVKVVTLPENRGKGAALASGIRQARELGYSHALQMDADGQHDSADIANLLALAKDHPGCLISGQPVYGDDVPKVRLYGRYITHFWVWIETLSFSIKDSLCGFRVYPVAATADVLDRHAVGMRMDFDPEIMVRLYWDGTPSLFLPTKVCYPEDGISHFDTLRDNIRISKMHTRLFFGMLRRLPMLVFNPPGKHWARTKERRGLWGMRFMFQLYRLCGRLPFEFILWFVTFAFWISGGAQARASRQYIDRLNAYCAQQGLEKPEGLNSFNHFLRFGNAMLDKIASWNGNLKWNRDVFFAPGAEAVLYDESPTGKLILASHLGDIEVCRALAETSNIRRINALVFHEHAANFNRVVSEIAPQASINLIPVSRITPETAILLKEKLDANEWVAIVGDRIATGSNRQQDNRISWAPFLGKPAPFPHGPFILAALLKCPVVLMFALKKNRKIVIHCEHFANPMALPRTRREQALQDYIQRYAERLQHYTLESPLDWFNFHDFWTLPDAD